MMDWPAFDFASHASEVVCVAIGTNLLLPVAPEIMFRFFRGIETNPDKIIGRNFSEDIQSYLDDKDLQKIGETAVSIRHRQTKEKDAPGLGWRVADVVFAVLGVFLLWSGLIDNTWVALLCPLLFAPAVIATGWPFACFAWSLARLNWRISKARRHATRKMKRLTKRRGATADVEIDDFVSKAKQAISEKHDSARR